MAKSTKTTETGEAEATVDLISTTGSDVAAPESAAALAEPTPVDALAASAAVGAVSADKDAGQDKTTAAEVPSMATQQVQAAFQITLKEFAQKLSLRDNRVELIGAFVADETRKGVVKDYESNFQARYVAFSQLVIED